MYAVGSSLKCMQSVAGQSVCSQLQIRVCAVSSMLKCMQSVSVCAFSSRFKYMQSVAC